MSGSDWAAWVQAIGSVAAIVAAIGVVRYQHALEVKRAEAERVERRRAMLRVWLGLFAAGSTRFEEAETVAALNQVTLEWFTKAASEVEAYVRAAERLDLGVFGSLPESIGVVEGISAMTSLAAVLRAVEQRHAAQGPWAGLLRASLAGVGERITKAHGEVEGLLAAMT